MWNFKPPSIIFRQKANRFSLILKFAVVSSIGTKSIIYATKRSYVDFALVLFVFWIRLLISPVSLYLELLLLQCRGGLSNSTLVSAIENNQDVVQFMKRFNLHLVFEDSLVEIHSNYSFNWWKLLKYSCCDLKCNSFQIFDNCILLICSVNT